MNTNKRRDGFTLVELAIVLVIIGLLVGGVLVGQDLIKAATIRSTVSDIEKTNTAATTFRTKYSGLPGDLLTSRANEYGLQTNTPATATANTTGRTGGAGMGDGNGLVEGCSAAATLLGCETAYYWSDLSRAALIAARLTTYEGASTTVTATSTTINTYLPKQKLRDSALLHVFPYNGKNYFFLGAITATTAGVPTLGAAGATGVTPGEARSIDEKFDDAYPASGVVMSMGSTFGVADAETAASSTTCTNGNATTPKVYNVIDANINNTNCQLMLRANF